MRLSETPVLIIDCQTTGMRPSVGSLLEIAWSWLDLGGETEPVVFSSLVALPPEATIPPRVSEITGITDYDMKDARPEADVLKDFIATIGDRAQRPKAVIHYAQFEKPFLQEFLKTSDEAQSAVGNLPFDIVCTHQIVKKLFPQLPSRNIRGVSGFFGGRLKETKRAGDHVRATIAIWRGLVEEFEKRGIHTEGELAAFLALVPEKVKSKPKQTGYEYRIDKQKRLGLPERPGVYRMLSRSGEILYVGKATSLRDRVNSYFRGKKGRDPRKLEMLAQVWDLETTECGSALEAALLETDEIKKHDPPYNVSLKKGRRRLIFYNRDFDGISDVQNETHPFGPFRPYNSIEDLRLILRSLEIGEFLQVFNTPAPIEDLKAGFQIFCERRNVNPTCLLEMRDFLALGVRLFREERRCAPQLATEESGLELAQDAATDPIGVEAEGTPNSNEVPELEADDEALEVRLSPEEIAEKFVRNFVRAGREIWRARTMTRLLNSNVSWTAETGPREIEVHGGKIGPRLESGEVRRDFPWLGLDIEDYDRMSVLLSGISPVSHRIKQL